MRSLARRGIEVHVAPFDFRAPALRSRRITRAHWLPYYLGDGASWLEQFRSLVREERFDLVIPCDERSILPLNRHRQEFESFTNLAIPGSEAIDILYDKHNTRELARSVGIPVAPGRMLLKDDTAGSLMQEFGLPLVLKPRRSYRLESLYVRSNALVIMDAKSILRALHGVTPDQFIVEGFFEGFGVGVSVLAKHGRILQAFQHERLHESHLVGGSSYRRSVPVEPALEEACEKTLRGLQYTGLAMFEFRKRRSSDEFILLEINARPWGSLPLPVSLGVDFPYFWYQLLKHDVEVPRVRYRYRVYGRNLMQDYHYLRFQLSRLRHAPVKMLLMAAGWLLSFRQFFIGRETWDALVLDDPIPGVIELSRIFERLTTIVSKWTAGPHSLRRRRARRALITALGKSDDKQLLIFVCQGNICRSPFAALQLERFLQAGSKKPQIVSAGMLPIEGRPSPQTALVSARERGVDLNAHKSQHLSPILAESASAVIIFDDRNRQSIKARYPDSKTPVLRLSDLGGGHDAKNGIYDPNGYDLTTFRATYAAITDCNRAIAELIRSRLSQRPRD